MADTPALTTTFTPPSSCLTQIYLEAYSNVPGYANVLGNVRDTASCLPSALDPMRTSFFSPGLYCPSGYTRACSTTLTIGSAEETQATCCPIGGFTCKTSDYWAFDSSFGCQWYYPTTTVVTATTLSSGAYYTTQKTMGGDYDYLNAFSVQLRWQSTDLVKLTTAPSSISSTTAAVTSSASTGSTSSHSAGLSDGAKLGIGLGIGIPGGIIAGAILMFVFMWLRKRRTSAPGWNNEPGAMSSHQPAVNSGVYGGVVPGSPSYGVPRTAELHGRSYIPEVSGSSK